MEAIQQPHQDADDNVDVENHGAQISIRTFPHTLAEYKRRFLVWLDRTLGLSTMHLAQYVQEFTDWHHWQPIPDKTLFQMVNILNCSEEIVYVPTGVVVSHGPLEWWDTSEVTSMAKLFAFRDSASRRILHVERWCTRNVTDMSDMFRGCSGFNEPIGDWDVRNVTRMDYMFQHATQFNQPLSNWAVDNVVTMQSMFHGALKFNQPLRTWNVSQLQNMDSMFEMSGMSQRNRMSTVMWHVPRLRKNDCAFDYVAFTWFPSNPHMRLEQCCRPSSWRWCKWLSRMGSAMNECCIVGTACVLGIVCMYPYNTVVSVSQCVDEVCCLRYGRVSCTVVTCCCFSQDCVETWCVTI